MKLVAFVLFTDGERAVYEDAKGQFVIDDLGERVDGVWFIPPDLPDEPIRIDSAEPRD